MIYRNRVFQWWMGPIVGAGAGVVLWIRTDNAKLNEPERFYMMLGTIGGCALAGVIVSGLDYLYSRAAAHAEDTGVPPLPLLGYFFALSGILFCWLPIMGIVLNGFALWSSRERPGTLRNCNWLALCLGVTCTIALFVMIALGI